MNLLLLAGNSIRNREWIYKVKEALAPLANRSIVHEYAHWLSSEEFINFDAELRTLKDKVGDLGEYCIFAKSVGSVLTLKGIKAGDLTPVKCVLTGLPLALIEKDKIPVEEWLKQTKTPMLIVQNTNDPLGSFSEVEKYIANCNINENCSVVELPGNDHDYDDLPKLKQLVGNFINL